MVLLSLKGKGLYMEALSAEKVDLFENMKISKAVAKLSVPTVFACLVMVIYNLVDTFFVGMLNDPDETTAVTLVAPVILLFNMVNNLFGVGTGSLMSRALGSRDYETVKRTSAFGIYAAALSGVIFSIVSICFRDPILELLGSYAADRSATIGYMEWTVMFGAAPAILNVVMAYMVRSEGSSLHATIGTVSGCVINMILDPFFILPFGLNMGAAGAGCATFIANCVATLYFVLYILKNRGKTFVSLNIREAIPSKEILKEVLGVGVPSAIQNILNVTGMTILNNKMAIYGTEAVSAIGIAHKLAMIPMYVSMGIGQGIMPLIGYNFSSGNRNRIKQTIRFTVAVSAGIVLILIASAIVFPGAIISAFMENAPVIEYGAAFLRALCCATPFLALDFLAVGIFQACGFGKYAFYFAIARKVVLEIPAIFILDYLYPMYGIPYSQLCAEIVLSVAAVILIKKIVSEPRTEKSKVTGDGSGEDMSNDKGGDH